jgi:hypothetical protein
MPSRRAGHASVQITADRYGHLVPASDAAAAASVGRALAGQTRRVVKRKARR